MAIIRSLEPADIEAIHIIDASIQREYRGDAWDSLSAAERATYLWYPQALPSGAEAQFLLVAVQGEDVIGFLFAFRNPLAPSRLWADGVAVVPHARRQGVAHALYAELIDRARTAGISSIVTRISLDNEPSARLHQTAGFELIQCWEASARLD